ITGASGAGKSTLLHLLGGMDMPDQGSVFFDGHALGTMPDKQRRHVWNTSFGLVFQNPYLINELTVLENVMLKGLAGGLNHTACVTTAQHLLKAVGLEDKMDSKPSTLSGGQQQRVALARALFGKPAFLLADELTGNLDATTGAALVDFLLKCQQEWHMGIILSTHDMGIASRMQERLCLREGRLVE
ncbi:MAG TPA: ATP-binding cassette domain-containing protein, partial [Candidatus Limnocylindria bacterium]|nr:ATP-binding cassette domain-containing protein [Candidatus Limnocylindria bacterium]